MKSRGKVYEDDLTCEGKNGEIRYSPAMGKMSQALKIREENYRLLLNYIDECILIIEVDGNRFPGKIMEVNDRACMELGYSRDELTKLSIKDIVAEEIHDTIPKKLENLKNLRHTKFRSKYVRKDKSILNVETKAFLFVVDDKEYILAISKNIEEHLKVESMAKESEERYKILVESLPEAVYVHFEGKIVFSNKSGAKLLGYDAPQDIIGRSLYNFLDCDEEEALFEDGMLMADLSKKVYKIKRKNGEIIAVEISSSIIPFDGKSYTLSIFRDVTERMIMESNLKNALAENKTLLEKAKRYDNLKTEFFSSISHDLKTPINIILGAVQLTKELHKEANSCQNYAKINKYINMMKQNCYRLLRLINNIVDITKIDGDFLQLNLRKHNIVKTVEDITQSVKEYVESKGIELIFHTDVKEKIVLCDEDKIERIMLNLLSNAVKYTDKGGVIKVSIIDKGEWVAISVKDNGVGIPKDKLDTIFDRFKKVNSFNVGRKEGSGIGLSLVKCFVEAHNGNIYVKSQVNKGSEFIMELPVVEDKGAVVMEDVENQYDKDMKVERITIEFSDIYS